MQFHVPSFVFDIYLILLILISGLPLLLTGKILKVESPKLTYWNCLWITVLSAIIGIFISVVIIYLVESFMYSGEVLDDTYPFTSPVGDVSGMSISASPYLEAFWYTAMIIGLITSLCVYRKLLQKRFGMDDLTIVKAVLLTMIIGTAMFFTLPLTLAILKKILGIRFIF